MVVVFGSLIADLVFPVADLPRPGETVACARLDLFPGGKGANQAVAAARAGADVRMSGCVGEDPFGELLVDALRSSGINVDAVRRVPAPTGCAAVCVDRRGQNQIAIAVGANAMARAEQVDDRWLGPTTILVLEMEVPAEENWKLLLRARERGARTVLNAAPAGPLPEDALRRIDVLIVNEVEAASLARSLKLEAAEGAGFASAVSGRYGPACVVTLGGEGAVACFSDGVWRVGALPIRPVDTTAAGDAFVGAFAASLDSGDSPVVALRRASVAGGLACLVAGAQPSLPMKRAIEARLGQLAPPRRA